MFFPLSDIDDGEPCAHILSTFQIRKSLKWQYLAKPGRPKGYPKTGGRQKGAVEKIKREAILAAQGITPLDYMMGIVRNEKEDKTVRLDAAKAAAPYVHARLQTTTLAGDPEKPLKVDNLSDLEAARRLAFLMTKAAGNAA
jgi:hypothetical protein